MKKLLALLAALTLLTGCASSIPEAADPTPAIQEAAPVPSEGVTISMEDDAVTVTGDTEGAVYTKNDIVYYPTGKDFTFGEGTDADAHEAAEADAHTVVHITKPGTYTLTGTLSKGQVAVDLGEDAEDDPNAVVTLILDNADITCSVAPAVIFYNVYECGDKDDPSETVDTSAAGANVVLAEGSVNHITGSHVARIYKEGSVELSEDGTEVLDAKKLHKYDAAFYSKMSMNVGGEGTLHITADNEGLDSELHLTVNGGEIYIRSGNDGINTNEDGVSVTTINGGLVDITVTGETGEGDGIDSNGWLVINGGEVRASACGFSGDAGIDSDMGIYLNGGTVAASGHMLDRIAGGDETYCVFTFMGTQPGGESYTMKNAAGDTVCTATPANDFSILIMAGGLSEGEYSLYRGEELLSAAPGQQMGGGMMPPAGEMPEGMQPPEMPEELPPMPEELPPMPEVSENYAPKPDGPLPEPRGGKGDMAQMPEGMTPPQGGFGGRMEEMAEASTVLTLKTGENYFTVMAK